MDIKIVKSARQCGGCESGFVHEETVHSLARIVDHELTREDYCSKCWSDHDTDRVYSSWRTTYYDPEVAEAEPAESFSPLRQAFYESLESDARGQLAIAYLGAQLLRRQKVFRLIKETEGIDDEPTIVLFNDRLGNRLIEVKDPDLSHAELEQGRVALMERLYEIEGGQSESDDDDDDDKPVVETELEHAASQDTDA